MRETEKSNSETISDGIQSPSGPNMDLQTYMGLRHTPAPWGDDERKSIYIRKATFLATVHYDSVEADANTALIKAAPELLAALKEAEDHIKRTSGGGETAIRAKLNSAIAKAEGR